MNLGISYIRFSTLFCKECMRFFKVYNQTVLSPVVNALIFFAIFTLAFGNKSASYNTVEYKIIVATGLIAMSCLQGAYQNTQATITVAKMLGFVKDYTITPLTRTEIILAMVLSALVRSLIVGSVTFIALLFFVNFTCYNIFYVLYYIICGSIIFAFVGILVGFTASDFDKAHAYTSYIITPLTMLSGTFYSTSSLPEVWQNIVFLNPVFYIIEGFRFGMTGFGNHSLFGFIMVLILIPIFGIWAMVTLRRGMYGKN